MNGYTHKQIGYRQRGFTLVELLIVIVVIAILAVISIVAYNGVQQRARDSSRMDSVAVIKKNLEYYMTDNSTYPPACGVDNTGCIVDNLNSYLSPYINKVPEDPNYPTVYFQYVRGTGGQSYAILVSREIGGQCKTGVNVAAGWWGTSVPLC